LWDVAAGACPDAPPQPTRTRVAIEARKSGLGELAVRIAGTVPQNPGVLDGMPPKCFDSSENVSSPSFATLDGPAPESAPAPLGRAGDYELLLEIASGGMATVFLGRAIDGRAGAPLVAIKRPHKHLATDKIYLSMLLDEARLASAMQADNVARSRWHGWGPGAPFIFR